MNTITRDDESVRDQRSWHLDKRLNIGHLLTTLVLALGVFTWASKIEQRVLTNESDNKHTKELMQLNQNYVTATVSSIDNKVDKLDGKIDKVLDRINVHDYKARIK